MKSIQFSLSFSGNVIVELVHVVGRRGRLVMQASKPHPVRNVKFSVLSWAVYWEEDTVWRKTLLSTVKISN